LDCLGERPKLAVGHWLAFMFHGVPPDLGRLAPVGLVTTTTHER
jgi:hypothetical protein